VNEPVLAAIDALEDKSDIRSGLTNRLTEATIDARHTV
jgi:hypothetical protein